MNSAGPAGPVGPTASSAAGVVGRLAWGAAIAVAVAVVLLSVNAPLVAGAGVETGDFAANTLLILDAKSFGLLTGNYSRVGFNHPGPAILYVLAAGEAVIHDRLGLVSSPFAGQLVAVSLYATIWIVLIFRVLCRAFEDTAPAALATAVFTLCIAMLDGQTLNGPWFPHLYVCPFAAFVVAISRLVHGRTDSLGTLAVSAGFLVNGHASFGVVMLVMGLTVLAANTVLETDRGSGTRIASRRFWGANLTRLAVAGALLFVFFIPLLILTVRAFPGPVMDYLNFGAHRKSNGILASLRFIWFFWGGPVPFVVGAVIALPALVLLGRRSDLDGFTRGANGLIAAFVAAFLAMLTYARHGVDMIELQYIGYFYYAVPALAAGLAAACLLKLVRSRLRAAVALVAWVFCLAGVHRAMAQPGDYVVEYNAPGVVDIYRAVKPLAAAGRIVLDLDGSNDWGYVWGHVVGVQAYAKRRHEDLFCIDRSWHILFTRKALCTAAELAGHPRYTVRKAEPTPGGPPQVAVQGLVFTRTGP
ncbi:hypothetical protein CH341_13270 [Rhodoplanes roseus]|uniref:Glycosyltransferase RgtA/B/C/D-like domain-containing protein n=1 Tax=Rhodoplanes roseus TaxID=29409 RepID=A0A327L116_9BRAD|nr:hypothetical protein CH341_13270 [Rhodoplanes roseus]